MIIKDLNEIPDAISSGKLTEKEAVNEIAIFVSENYPIFGLHKYDEDFRSEILTQILEHSDTIFPLYDPKLGDFFSYFFCFMKNLIRTRIKKLSKHSLQEAVAIQESILEYDQKIEEYMNTEKQFCKKLDKQKKEIDFMEIEKNFKETEKDDKTLLVLALKASYYLTDEQIQRICKLYSLNEENFYNYIQYCKEQMNNKIEKRKTVEERRNSAYFRHRRYKLESEKTDDEESNKIIKNMILEKENKQRSNWKNINERLEKGYLYLRPTNKVIAELLGICERQVSYYINYAKKLDEKKK